MAIKVTAKKQAQYDAILEYMLAGKEYKASEFEQVLGVKTSRIKVILSEMINAGLIEPDGENKNRVYRLKHD